MIVLFIAGLILSGLTAFPLLHELNLLATWVDRDSVPGALRWWILQVRDGLAVTYHSFPFIAYGTDWLAFAHLVIAMFFLGPLRDPVGNAWVLRTGLVACAAVIPLALICGPIRGIPFFWRLIDCSFGIGGFVLLWAALRAVRRFESAERHR